MCLNVNLMVDFSFKCFQICCVNSHLLVFEEDNFCFLPFETFAGTSMCQNYLNDFHAGIWDATHEVFLFHIHLHTKRTLWHYSCWYASSWLWNPSDSVPLLISWQWKFTVVLLLILLIIVPLWRVNEPYGFKWTQFSNSAFYLCSLPFCLWGWSVLGCLSRTSLRQTKILFLCVADLFCVYLFI